MAKSDGTELYLNRRSHPRVDYRTTVRLISDPKRPLRLARAITQNLSLRGVQILSPTILDKRRPFDVWITLNNANVLHASAKVAWVAFEDTFSDSPYWIRAGLTFTPYKTEDRRALTEALGEKTRTERLGLEQEQAKIAYIF